MGLGTDIYQLPGGPETSDVDEVFGWMWNGLCDGGRQRFTDLTLLALGERCPNEGFGCPWGRDATPHYTLHMNLWCHHPSCKATAVSSFVSVLASYDDDELAAKALDWAIDMGFLARVDQPTLDTLGIREFWSRVTQDAGQRLDTRLGLERPRGRPRKVA